VKNCKATTGNGTECANPAADETGFCRTHHPDAAKRPSTGDEFEESVLKVLRLLGYTVQRNVTVAGCQIDILAEYRTGVIRLRLIVECKDYGEGRTVGVEDVKNFSGVLHPVRGKAVDKGLLVARGGFTRAAKELAESAGILLVEFAELANQLLDFDAYIERVIKEFDDSPVARYYIDLSYAFTEDYAAGDPELIHRPLDDAVNRILFQEITATETIALAPSTAPNPRIAIDQEQTANGSQSENYSFTGTGFPDKPQTNVPASARLGAVLQKGKLALLGNFGTGKTTWCKKYARDLAIQYQKDHTRRIPIVVSLSDYETKLDIQQLVTNTLQFRYGVRVDLSICQELQRLGRFLFIFDGLDEMATRVDAEVVRENLREINKVARIQENVFVVTCRTHFFRDRVQSEVLANFETLFIPEWGEVELREYLRKRFGDEWEKQLDRIRGTHNLAELAQTPLFLEMITETLPKLGEQVRRSELYETYTESWISEQSQRRGARLQSKERKQFVMELATKLYKDTRHSCHYSEFSEMLRSRFNIQDASQIDYLQSDVRSCTFLTRNANGDYEFKHKSFMEYFVAAAIKEQFSCGSNELIRLKPLPVEVKGFLVELLSNATQSKLLIDWHQTAQDPILKDNIFALMVGLRIALPAELRSKQSPEIDARSTVLLFLQGDTAAFTQLVHQYLPRVESQIRHITKTPDLTSEVAFDAFFSVLQKRDRIASPKDFLPYLLTTATWKAIDIVRQEHRAAGKTISLDEHKQLADSFVDSSSLKTPEAVLIQKEDEESQRELLAKIKKAMNQLPELERKVIQESLFDGATPSEVAIRNRMSVQQVKLLRFNGVLKIRRLFANEIERTLTDLGDA